MLKELFDYLEIIRSHPDRTFALATIISVKGSAYRKERAKMLFRDDGVQYGTISAGCIEEDLAHHAQEVMDIHRTMVRSYDLRGENDLDWGAGAGCNGKIDVFIEPMSWRDKTKEGSMFWEEFHDRLLRGKKVATVRRVSGCNQGITLCLDEDGNFFGSLNNNRLKQHLEKGLTSFMGSQRLFEKRSEFFYEIITPKEALYLFGAGSDVEPIVSGAVNLGFKPIVIDPRESRCNNKHFPLAFQLIVEHPATFLEKYDVPFYSFVLVMTHKFKDDQKILRYFLNNRPYFLGVLGPKRRAQRLVAPALLPEWVSSPLGVSIGAEGADEICISILAELIKVRQQQPTGYIGNREYLSSNR